MEDKQPKQRESVDPRVLHAGKAGQHKAKQLDIRRGRCRKFKHRNKRGW